MKEAAMMLVNDCKVKVKASDADVKALKEKKIPDSHEGLCLIECLFSTAKIMENGKFSKQGTIDLVEPAMKGDAGKIKKMKSMMDECEKEIGDGDADPCKTAKLIAVCTTTKGKSFGFKFPDKL